MEDEWSYRGHDVKFVHGSILIDGVDYTARWHSRYYDEHVKQEIREFIDDIVPDEEGYGVPIDQYLEDY